MLRGLGLYLVGGGYVGQERQVQVDDVLLAEDGANSEYRLARVDGKEMRNLLAMANDGLPNMSRWPQSDSRG